MSAPAQDVAARPRSRDSGFAVDVCVPRAVRVAFVGILVPPDMVESLWAILAPYARGTRADSDTEYVMPVRVPSGPSIGIELPMVGRIFGIGCAGDLLVLTIPSALTERFTEAHRDQIRDVVHRGVSADFLLELAAGTETRVPFWRGAQIRLIAR